MSKLKIKNDYIKVISEGTIIVRPPPNSKSSINEVLLHLMKQLPKVVIKVHPAGVFLLCNLKITSLCTLVL
jgi:hypothetical protein